jgi:hypothetical protein
VDQLVARLEQCEVAIDGGQHVSQLLAGGDQLGPQLLTGDPGAGEVAQVVTIAVTGTWLGIHDALPFSTPSGGPPRTSAQYRASTRSAVKVHSSLAADRLMAG